MATKNKPKPAASKSPKTATMENPRVDYVRLEVRQLLPRWQKIRDCVAGQDEVKLRRTQYLPAPNPTDLSDENKSRYLAYLLRAIFYNVCSWTLRGLLGEVFKKLPVLEIPPALDVLKVDVDGGGIELDQQATAALSNVVQFGRAGLLADYPKVNGAVTKADLDLGLVRPTITLFQPWDIINWRTVTVGGKKLLSLVVTSERYVTDDDGFEAEQQNRFRVMRLDKGVYITEFYEFDDTAQIFTKVETITPVQGNGQPWPFIPFQFIGSENNEPTPDLPPMYDLAEINLGHYRNSADYEEICYIVGQPTPVLSGLTEDWAKVILKGKVELGSRGVIPLPAGGTAELLQASPNPMPMEAMKHKEDQMKSLGAKLLEPGSVKKTATQVSIDSASETSLLASCAKNVSQAYTKALEWCGVFINDSGKVSYELSTDFEEGMTPADIPNIIAAWQGRAIAQEEMRDALRNVGIAYLDDNDYKDALDKEGPNMGLPVDPNQAAADKAAADLAIETAKGKAKENNAPTPPAK